ncbi:Nucleoside-diphosphate-sugar epimerase [Mycobacterium rhizamassiliense]|jgi:UDP-glucose 4-epimerase|uniref:Nucleoside-diphosphate-sugar epimerase n=1 Tax=Mycobacterium rhizamassiliense TaxID=1841860 RepID=A0A2U3P1I1_9MYCO|nr:NAD-dependent epimerase/dehydratase family protein [Mycobacterium rhizamassiliense]SPM37610.1 Nucleoside-diphosphate-sugar epimerase [Mycobacterium rhizamassiliense]
MTRERPKVAVVTGAAGFIGSHLADYLLAAGWSVRGLDDLSAGSMDNLRGALGSESFEFVEGSVLDEPLLRATVAGATHVFHLAAHLGGFFVEQHPERTVLETIEATRTLLSVVSESRTPMFFASTSEIYGDADVQPLVETTDIVIAPPLNPRSSYALGKGVGELLVNEYFRKTGAPVVIGRLFNTVGPRQSGRYGPVLPRFIESARTNQPLTVYGDGKQTRSFTSVCDAVEAIAAALGTPAAHGHTINIGSCVETSINDLAEEVIAMTGSTSSIRWVPFEEAHGPASKDIRRRIPDTTKLRTLVDYQCTTPLATVLDTLVGHR